MGRAVGAHQPGAVDREQHRQVLQCDIVNQLIVAALQEGRVNRHHRLQAFAGKPAGEGQRMLFGNAHVVIAARKACGKFNHPGAFTHRRGDADDPLVGLCHIAQPFAEHLGVGRLAAAFSRDDAPHRIEFSRPVIQHRIGLGQLVALPLARDHVQKLRPFEKPHVLQGGNQRFEVVAIDRTDVVETELLEHGAWHNHALGMLFEPLGQLP